MKHGAGKAGLEARRSRCWTAAKPGGGSADGRFRCELTSSGSRSGSWPTRRRGQASGTWECAACRQRVLRRAVHFKTKSPAENQLVHAPARGCSTVAISRGIFPPATHWITSSMLCLAVPPTATMTDFEFRAQLFVVFRALIRWAAHVPGPLHFLGTVKELWLSPPRAPHVLLLPGSYIVLGLLCCLALCPQPRYKTLPTPSRAVRTLTQAPLDAKVPASELLLRVACSHHDGVGTFQEYVDPAVWRAAHLS